MEKIHRPGLLIETFWKKINKPGLLIETFQQQQKRPGRLIETFQKNDKSGLLIETGCSFVTRHKIEMDLVV